MPPLPTGTHFVGDNTFLARAYALESNNEATRSLYDEWATSYDRDLAEEEYMSPQKAVEAVVGYLGDLSDGGGDDGEGKRLEVLDAGCGTGLVGVCLARALGGSGGGGEVQGVGMGKVVRLEIDGLDLSRGMLDVAQKTGVYRDLETADLTKKIEKGDGLYDVVMCVGTLTQGHVGPGVLKEFVRVVKGKGLVVATVLEDIFESGGYKKEVEELEREGKVEVLGLEEFGIRKGKDKGGRMVVLRAK